MSFDDVLEKLRFAVFEFVLAPEQTIVFPEFKGNVFRGALGKTLRHLTCAFKEKKCTDCLIHDKCIYSKIFESIHTTDNSILKNVENAPHPFVLYIPEQHSLEYPVKPGAVVPENSKILFSLTLVGEAIEYISYFILAFEEIGKKGIGKTKAPFKIEKVQCAGKHIYDPEMKKITRDFPLVYGRDFIKEETQVQSITMEMESPLRLKFGRKFQKYISFDMLVPNLLRRIQLLSALYCEGPPRVDFKELIEKAKEVKVSDSEIHWEEQRRFSFRQERTLSLGGVSGSIEFTGNISPYMPFLRIGEYLHVGKGTAFGLGKIKINAME